MKRTAMHHFLSSVVPLPLWILVCDRARVPPPHKSVELSLAQNTYSCCSASSDIPSQCFLWCNLLKEEQAVSNCIRNQTANSLVHAVEEYCPHIHRSPHDWLTPFSDYIQDVLQDPFNFFPTMRKTDVFCLFYHSQKPLYSTLHVVHKQMVQSMVEWMTRLYLPKKKKKCNGNSEICKTYCSLIGTISVKI